MDVLRLIMFHFPNLEWNKEFATLRNGLEVLKCFDSAFGNIEEYFGNIPDSMTTLLLNGIFLEPWLFLGQKSYWESSSIE